MPDNDRLINERDVELAGFNLTTVLQEAAWAVEPREVPVELTPDYRPVLHTIDHQPVDEAAIVALRVITEKALHDAHLLLAKVDNDEV